MPATDPYRKAAQATAIVTETDLAGTITQVNDRFCALSGFTAVELLGQNHRILKSGHHSAEFYAAMWDALVTQGIWHGDLCNRRKDHSLYWVATTLVALTDDATGLVRGYAAIRFDVTERYELMGRLQSLAYYDTLTGLPNRAALQVRFYQVAQQKVDATTAYVLCVFDIDRFSTINEIHGQDTGDAVLRQLGQRALEFTGGETGSVFHWGGDEFVVLLLYRPQQDIKFNLVRQLMDVLAQPIVYQGTTLSVTCSAGVSDFSADDLSPDILLRHANLALYQAKAQGPRSIVFYENEQFEQVQQQEALQRDLRVAMASGHLQVYYQPKLDLRQGRVIGAEALLRWIHPETGAVPPLEFLPRIENLPVALEIDEWVLHQALLFLQLHFAQQPHFTVSVNISARQFQSRDFPVRLRHILERFPGVRFQQLELEILESTAIEDFLQVNLNVAAIKALGVGVALDDFGVGYSSLAYLKKISPQTIKIDKTFILGILLNEDDLILTQSIINLSQSLEFEVVAEGVETVEHMMLLCRMGCTVVQGYGVLKPAAAAPFLDWLGRYQPSTVGAHRWQGAWDLRHRHLLAARQAYEGIQTLDTLDLGVMPQELQGLHALARWGREIGQASCGCMAGFDALMSQHERVLQGIDALSKAHFSLSVSEFQRDQMFSLLVSAAEVSSTLAELCERVFVVGTSEASEAELSLAKMRL